MKLKKAHILIFAFMLFAASTSFANSIYSVAVDTSSLSSTDGYIYFQYIPAGNAVDSIATLSNLEGGVLAALPSENVVNGSAVKGVLPGPVMFSNANGINDYNHGIRFGNNLSFIVSFSGLYTGGEPGGSSTFSFWLFRDANGVEPLITTDGALFMASLDNGGMIMAQAFSDITSFSQVPESETLWLLGAGLIGMVAVSCKNKKAGWTNSLISRC